MKLRFRRSHAIWLTGLTILVAGLLIGSIPSCRRVEQAGLAPTSENDVADQREQEIVAFCSGCHSMPNPTSFPKGAWRDEVKRGFDFYYESNRRDLIPPSVLAVEDYFRSRAPEKLVTVPDPSVAGPARVHFRRHEVKLAPVEPAEKNAVAISFVRQWPIKGSARNLLLFSDMGNGGVYVADPNVSSVVPHRVMRLHNPVVASRCDLNGNGQPDLVVADLGSVLPADHELGRVMWLADFDEKQSERSAVPLAEGLGRVADVQPADFDGDGDIDLVVAEFGWHKTGRILLLRNEGTASSPRFVRQVIDSRPGTIHVPVVDLNHDGRPDFVALISQEFETVVAFLNQPDGTFQKHTIYSAEDPAYGSSGIQVVDLDQDGDDDVLFNNGDMFDSFLIKPYFGIQWLENTGTYPFTPHRLTTFPGVLRALAGDLDRDGDLDLVAGAFLPVSTRETAEGKSLDSLIWLEQTSPGQFVRHAIEQGNCVHATLDLVDLDGDGDLDIATGAFNDRPLPNASAVTIWWNDLATP